MMTTMTSNNYKEVYCTTIRKKMKVERAHLFLESPLYISKYLHKQRYKLKENFSKYIFLIEKVY
jgi:hypothetical protein